MFGVGATVGTGVFFVMHEAVPDAGPAVIVSFVLAGLAAGLSALSLRRDGLRGAGLRVDLLLRLRDARRGRRDGRRGLPAARVRRVDGGGRGRAGAATSTSCWTTCSAGRSRPRCPPRRGTPTPGIINLPAVVLVALCALLLIRGARESAKVNAIMVVIKLAVLVMFVAIAFTAFNADNFADFAPHGRRRHHGRRRDDLLHLHRPRRRLDRRRRGARPAEDDAARDPRSPWRSSRRSTSSSRSPPSAPSRGRSSRTPRRARPGWPRSCEDVVGATWPGTILAAGAVISIFSVTLVTHVRADPHPVRDRPRRTAARRRSPGSTRARTRRCSTPSSSRSSVGAARRASSRCRLPVGPRVHRHPGRVHRRLGRRDHPAPDPARPAARLQGPRLPGHAGPADRSPASTSCPACTGTRTRGSCCGSAWCSRSTSCGAAGTPCCNARSRQACSRTRTCGDDRRRRQPVRRRSTARSTSASRSPARCPRRRGRTCWSSRRSSRPAGPCRPWPASTARCRSGSRRVPTRPRPPALDFLEGRADGLTIEFVRLRERSTPRALAALAEARDATALVLGSSPDGPEGRVVVGSTADYLAALVAGAAGHRAEVVPLRAEPDGRRGAPAHLLVQRLRPRRRRPSAGRRGSRARSTSGCGSACFGVRSATMYPPEIGTDIESEVTEQWRAQMVEAQATLRARLGDALDDDVELVVASGTSWWRGAELRRLDAQRAAHPRVLERRCPAARVPRHQRDEDHPALAGAGPRRAARRAVTDPWGVDRLDLDAYLARIGARPDDPLAAIHRAHVAAIPFENLDVQLGVGVSVDLPDVQAKLVGAHRGGYCYEHGILLAAALERLGHTVERRLARIGDPAVLPRPRSHLVAGRGRSLARRHRVRLGAARTRPAGRRRRLAPGRLDVPDRPARRRLVAAARAARRRLADPLHDPAGDHLPARRRGRQLRDVAPPDVPVRAPARGDPQGRRTAAEPDRPPVQRRDARRQGRGPPSATTSWATCSATSA